MQPPLIQDMTLDARRLLCPLPVIRVQKAIQQLQTDDTLTVLATDPGVLYDIPAWCRIHGHTVLTIEQTKQEIHIKIRVNSLSL
ncbi:MAG TPA: sulfurtransferase TusA family protein [Gammaproteobacteria bacterium]|nr:sulfurtransferase TusA family protein [Gammaproteobacteria bacterium]